MATGSGSSWRDFFLGLSTGGKLLLLSAVFFIFAPVGLLYELASSQPRPWWETAAWCAYSGLVAVGWAYAFSTRLRILALVLPLSWLLPAIFGRGFWGRGDVLSARGAESLAALLTLVVGYILYMAFIGREGLRSLRHRTEIDLARRIHDGLVPDVDRRELGFHLFGAARPATEVGGDLLDCVRIESGIAVFLADISGHGVAAGVRMAMVKSALRARLRVTGELADTVAALNGLHLEMLPTGMFTTFTGLRLEPGGLAHFTSAGHHPMLHWHAASGAIERRDLSQPPLGVIPDFPYASLSFAVETGDLLVFLTDGLTEVFDRNGEEFGLERFEKLVQVNAGLSLPELFRLLLESVAAFGEQLDDQTMLLIRRA